MITLEFLVTSLIVVPSTGVICTVCAGLIQRRWASIGCTAGIGVFIGMTFVVFVVYDFVVRAFRCFVVESQVQRWLRYTFARAFAGLGAKLAFSDK